ncbi:MAG: helix-turn-helix transcriptional regulator [Oscillospiraceae bacterium]|nr:helix-turn-helix transcriptional regulator [Oscillospiraceae bacterium]
MKLGEILRDLLAERDITQKQLADSLYISASTIGNYIQNTREPDYDTLKRFADYFRVTTDYLLDHRVSQTATHREDELLRLFRSLTKDQQELFLEQCKLFVTYNSKKGRSSESRITEHKSG